MLDICLMVGFKNTKFDRAVLDLLKLVTALIGCRLCWHYVTLKMLHMKNCSVPPASLYSILVAVQSSNQAASEVLHTSHVCFIALDRIAQAHVENT